MCLETLNEIEKLFKIYQRTKTHELREHLLKKLDEAEHTSEFCPGCGIQNGYHLGDSFICFNCAQSWNTCMLFECDHCNRLFDISYLI